jgi:hypothetical protein
MAATPQNRCGKRRQEMHQRDDYVATGRIFKPNHQILTRGRENFATADNIFRAAWEFSSATGG